MSYYLGRVITVMWLTVYQWVMLEIKWCKPYALRYVLFTFFYVSTELYLGYYAKSPVFSDEKYALLRVVFLICLLILSEMVFQSAATYVLISILIDMWCAVGIFVSEQTRLLLCGLHVISNNLSLLQITAINMLLLSIMMLCLSKAARMIGRKYRELIEKNTTMAAICAFFLCVLSCTSGSTRMEDLTYSLPEYLLNMIGINGTFLVVMAVLFWSNYKRGKQKRLQLLMQKEYLEEHLQTLYEQNNISVNLQKLIEDERNDYLKIDSEEEKTEQLKEYYKGLITLCGQRIRTEYHGNLILNSIIEKRVRQCKDAHIRIHFQNNDKEQIGTDTADWMNLYTSLFEWIEIESNRWYSNNKITWSRPKDSTADDVCFEVWIETEFALGKHGIHLYYDNAEMQKMHSTQNRKQIRDYLKERKRIHRHILYIIKRKNGSLQEKQQGEKAEMTIVL